MELIYNEKTEKWEERKEPYAVAEFETQEDFERLKDIVENRWPANEAQAAYMSDDDAMEDRKQFVRNLGYLMSQTRCGIIGAELDDNDIVTITYKGGGTREINVHMDSYAAIIRDVAKRMD